MLGKFARKVRTKKLLRDLVSRRHRIILPLRDDDDSSSDRDHFEGLACSKAMAKRFPRVKKSFLLFLDHHYTGRLSHKLIDILDDDPDKLGASVADFPSSGSESNEWPE